MIGGRSGRHCLLCVATPSYTSRHTSVPRAINAVRVSSGKVFHRSVTTSPGGRLRSCSRPGCTARSRASANGSTAPSGRVTRRGGAIRAQFSAATASTSAAMPQVRFESSITTSRPVFVHRRGQPVHVERVERARIEDLDRDLAGQLVGDRQRVVHQVADGDHRHVVAGPATRPTPSGTGASVGEVDIVADAERTGRREDDHRVVVADRRHQQAVGVRRRRRHHRLHPDVGEQAVRVVGVLPGPPGPRARARHHVGDRHLALPAGHQRELVRLVGDLLEDQEQQRRDLELDHRPHPGQRRAGGEVGERLLGHRRVEHPVRPEPRRAARRSRSTRDPDVLAEQEHRSGRAPSRRPAPG